jgi:hypothetical protein
MTITAPLFNMNWFEFSYRSNGIEDLSEEIERFRIFPNPSHGVLNVEGSLENHRSGEIQLFDLRGQLHLVKGIESTGPFTEALQLQQLDSGPYLLLVRGGKGETLARKLVIIGD